MIIGIGIDSVEIERFSHWHRYDRKKLLRIFSEVEIEYCLSNAHKSAERFAVRYAAREALYKALSQAFPTHNIPFLACCKIIAIHKDIYNVPQILLAKHFLVSYKIPNTLIDAQIITSFTHSKNNASAVVLFQTKDCS